MTNRVVLITGAAGGIGNATANVFKDDGWDVIGVDQKSSLPDTSSVDHHISMDISDPEAHRGIFTKIKRVTNRLDALVNNAAIQIVKPLLTTTIEEWDLTMAVNVRAAYLTIRHAHPLLCRHNGSVVNVSSVHAVAREPGGDVRPPGPLRARTSRRVQPNGRGRCW